ncbi:hypothetical protein [Cupriavidus basilensis]|uniref:hypothetical protein n=1 Tax=Cupriavidus basilensis TaxID=68895 RepID=UPI0039F70FC8
MAASLKARIVRLEQQSGGAGEPLIVILGRFDAPDDAFSGFSVNGEFFAREEGESMDAAEERIVEIMKHRRDAPVCILKPVSLRPCQWVEELPE